MQDNRKEIFKYIGIFLVAFIVYSVFSDFKYLMQAIQTEYNKEEQTQQLDQYPTVYSYGEHLKEIYTNPMFGIYVYLCTKDSKYKSDVNLFNGIYYEKPTAKVKGNTVQNIFIFDKFPDVDKFKNITEYETLLNAIIGQKPVMGFHRCYVKYLENYANQAYTYDKENQKYIFYYGAGGNWEADSSSTKDFNVEQFDYTGQWGYKPKTNTQTSPQRTETATLENSPALQAQYKAEIEKTINIETAKAKKEIDNAYQEADNLYNNILATGGYTTENYDKLESYCGAIDTPEFWIYVKLIDITKKYVNIGETPSTDFTPTLAEFIEPTLNKYKISNLNKLKELSIYSSQKNKEIELRLNGMRKTIYGDNQ